MSSPSPSPDWLIHECQACGSPMKIRAHTVVSGARITCPVCQSPVHLHTASQSSAPEFRVDLPAPSRPPEQARRKEETFARRDAEFSAPAPRPAGPPPSRPMAQSAPVTAEETPAGSTDDAFLSNLRHTGDMTTHRRKRIVKKRKAGHLRPEEISDWNSAKADIPEATVAADPWAKVQQLPEEVVNEREDNFVVSELKDDGGVLRRVKKIKKRRLLGLGREFFRRFTFTARVVIVAMVVALAGWAVWSNWEIIRTKWVATFYPEEALRARPPQIFLTSQDESGAVDVLHKYLSATTMEEKLQYVRLPERVRPLMEAWYKKHPDVPLEPGEVTDRSKIRAGSDENGHLYLVKLDMDVLEPDPLTPGRKRLSRRWYLVEEAGALENRTYKVDWEMAVRHQPMSWEEFRTRRPTEPVPFRVMLRGGDEYYNHEFTDEEKWRSVHLYYPDPDNGENFLFHGYIERSNPAWRDLEIFTVPGNSAAYILRLRYPQNSLSADQVIVDSVEHVSWFYTAADTAKPEPKK